MHAGFFDVFHDTTDQHLAGVITDRIDVHFGGICEESVDEHWTFGREPAFFTEAAETGQLRHCRRKMVAVVDNLHCPPSEHIARPDEYREADVLGDFQRLVEGHRGPTGRLRDLQLVANSVPPLAVLGGVDRIGRRPGD